MVRLNLGTGHTWPKMLIPRFFSRKNRQPSDSKKLYPWNEDTIWRKDRYFYIEVQKIVLERTTEKAKFITPLLKASNLRHPANGHFYPFEYTILTEIPPNRSFIDRKYYLVGRHCDKDLIEKFVEKITSAENK